MKEKVTIIFKKKHYTISCGGYYLNDIGPFIQYEDGDEVKEEFRGPGGKWIADIAILNAGNVRCIIEVQVTHKTVTPRPEPWYEIDANTFINYMNERESNQDIYNEDTPYYLECIRQSQNRKCFGSFCYKEPWAYQIPGYRSSKDKSCILCRKNDYHPINDNGAISSKLCESEIRLCYDCAIADIQKCEIRIMFEQDEFNWFKAKREKESALTCAKTEFLSDSD